MAAVTLRLFAAARVAAGRGRDALEAATVAEAMAQAQQRYGPGFAELLPNCRVWRNGEQAEPDDVLAEGDELAVLPPVSGG